MSLLRGNENTHAEAQRRREFSAGRFSIASFAPSRLCVRLDECLMDMQLARRQFFTSSASGLGALALFSLLERDGLLGDEGTRSVPSAESNPLAPKAPHFAPKAKNCIFFLPEGAPSHIDLFDPKPKLNELHGQKLPESMTQSVRFAFIQKESAVLLGCNRKFTPHGECGMELSDFLPHVGECADDICLVRSMHTDAFN